MADNPQEMREIDVCLPPDEFELLFVQFAAESIQALQLRERIVQVEQCRLAYRIALRQLRDLVRSLSHD